MSPWEMLPRLNRGKCSPTRSGRSRSSFWLLPRASSFSRRSSPVGGHARRVRSFARCRLGSRTTVRSPVTSKPSLERSETDHWSQLSRTRSERLYETSSVGCAERRRPAQATVPRHGSRLRRDVGRGRGDCTADRRRLRQGPCDRRTLLRRRDALELAQPAQSAARCEAKAVTTTDLDQTV